MNYRTIDVYGDRDELTLVCSRCGLQLGPFAAPRDLAELIEVADFHDATSHSPLETRIGPATRAGQGGADEGAS